MKKVLICGDRNWTDVNTIMFWLHNLLQYWGYDTVIQGEARGADAIAKEEAEKLGFTVLSFPANWNRYGKAAGPIRNREMLGQRPDLVLAFHSDIKNSKGTASTVGQAKAMRIRTILVEWPIPGDKGR